MKDFDKWNSIKKNIDARISADLPRVGEIWWCNLGLNVGSEQNGGGLFYERPVLIIKRYTPNTFMVLPVTSKKKKGNYFYVLDKINTVILSQSRVLDTKRLRRLMARLSYVQTREVIHAFKALL